MSYSGFVHGQSYVSKEEKELMELRQAAAEFYRLNRIPEELERALNELFIRKPSDVHGYLAEFFSCRSTPPAISRVQGQEVFDSRGQPSIQAQVYCTIRNQEKLVSSAAVSSHSGPGESNAEDRAHHVTQALLWIQELDQELRDLSPRDQDHVDHILSGLYSARVLELAESQSSQKDDSSSTSLSNMAPTTTVSPAPSNKKGKKGSVEKPLPPPEPPELVLAGSMAVGSVSLAVAKAGAQAKGMPLYQHLSELKNSRPASQMHVPLPLITVLSCGKSSPGKLNLFEEIIVVPKPGLRVREAVSLALELQKEALKILRSQTKAGACPVFLSDCGAPCVSLERPEQPLELLSEACSSLGLSLSSDLYLALSCAGPLLLDYVSLIEGGQGSVVARSDHVSQLASESKGKYEASAGLLKSPDEMVDLFQSLLLRFPSVVALIDPLRREDLEQWEKLSASIGESCSLLSELTYRTQAPPPPGVRGHVLKHFNHVTISDLVRISTEQEGTVLLGPSHSEPSSDPVLTDLAVGLGLDFLRMGGLSGAERTNKYNRLISIEEELERDGRLVSKEKLLPPVFIQKPDQDQDQDQNQDHAAAPESQPGRS